MVVGVSNQGLKKPFTLEKQKDMILKFEVFKKHKCLLTSVSYSSDYK